MREAYGFTSESRCPQSPNGGSNLGPSRRPEAAQLRIRRLTSISILNNSCRCRRRLVDGNKVDVLVRARRSRSGHQSLSIEHPRNNSQCQDVDDQESSSELQSGNERGVNDAGDEQNDDPDHGQAR